MGARAAVGAVNDRDTNTEQLPPNCLEPGKFIQFIQQILSSLYVTGTIRGTGDSECIT